MTWVGPPQGCDCQNRFLRIDAVEDGCRLILPGRWQRFSPNGAIAFTSPSCRPQGRVRLSGETRPQSLTRFCVTDLPVSLTTPASSAVSAAFPTRGLVAPISAVHLR